MSGCGGLQSRKNQNQGWCNAGEQRRWRRMLWIYGRSCAANLERWKTFRGTHAKLMIGSRSCLLQGDTEVLCSIITTTDANQRYVQEKSCFIVGSHYLSNSQENKGAKVVNKEQRLNQWGYSKTYFGLESNHFQINQTRKLLLLYWKLRTDNRTEVQADNKTRKSKWEPPLTSKIGTYNKKKYSDLKMLKKSRWQESRKYQNRKPNDKNQGRNCNDNDIHPKQGERYNNENRLLSRQVTNKKSINC